MWFRIVDVDVLWCVMCGYSLVLCWGFRLWLWCVCGFGWWFRFWVWILFWLYWISVGCVCWWCFLVWFLVYVLWCWSSCDRLGCRFWFGGSVVRSDLVRCGGNYGKWFFWLICIRWWFYCGSWLGSGFWCYCWLWCVVGGWIGLVSGWFFWLDKGWCRAWVGFLVLYGWLRWCFGCWWWWCSGWLMVVVGWGFWCCWWVFICVWLVEVVFWKVVLLGLVFWYLVVFVGLVYCYVSWYWMGGYCCCCV